MVCVLLIKPDITSGFESSTPNLIVSDLNLKQTIYANAPGRN